MDNVGGFDWDDGNWPKCGSHGVSREEIEFVLREGPLVLPDRTGAAEVRYNAVGKNSAGRNVFIVFTLRVREGLYLMRPIGARYMHGKEIATYERTKEA